MPKILIEFTVEIPPEAGVEGILTIPGALAAVGLEGLGIGGAARIVSFGEAPGRESEPQPTAMQLAGALEELSRAVRHYRKDPSGEANQKRLLDAECDAGRTLYPGERPENPPR